MLLVTLDPSISIPHLPRNLLLSSKHSLRDTYQHLHKVIFGAMKADIASRYQLLLKWRVCPDALDEWVISDYDAISVDELKHSDGRVYLSVGVVELPQGDARLVANVAAQGEQQDMEVSVEAPNGGHTPRAAPKQSPNDAVNIPQQSPNHVAPQIQYTFSEGFTRQSAVREGAYDDEGNIIDEEDVPATPQEDELPAHTPEPLQLSPEVTHPTSNGKKSRKRKRVETNAMDVRTLLTGYPSPDLFPKATTFCEGQLIVYKEIELNESMVPQISDWKYAYVLQIVDEGASNVKLKIHSIDFAHPAHENDAQMVCSVSDFTDVREHPLTYSSAQRLDSKNRAREVTPEAQNPTTPNIFASCFPTLGRPIDILPNTYMRINSNRFLIKHIDGDKVHVEMMDSPHGERSQTLSKTKLLLDETLEFVTPEVNDWIVVNRTCNDLHSELGILVSSVSREGKMLATIMRTDRTFVNVPLSYLCKKKTAKKSKTGKLAKKKRRLEKRSRAKLAAARALVQEVDATPDGEV